MKSVEVIKFIKYQGLSRVPGQTLKMDDATAELEVNLGNVEYTDAPINRLMK